VIRLRRSPTNRGSQKKRLANRMDIKKWKKELLVSGNPEGGVEQWYRDGKRKGMGTKGQERVRLRGGMRPQRREAAIEATRTERVAVKKKTWGFCKEN